MSEVELQACFRLSVLSYKRIARIYAPNPNTVDLTSNKERNPISSTVQFRLKKKDPKEKMIIGKAVPLKKTITDR